MRDKRTILRDHWFMRRTDPNTRDRQERALVLALSGMPVSKIADCLGYRTHSGAWKALRAAAARKTNSTPELIQNHLRESSTSIRRQSQARVLQDVLNSANN